MREVGRDRADPSKAEFLADALGFRLHDVRGEPLRDLGIDPLVAAVAEEIAIDLAAGFRVAVFAHQDGDGIGRIHRLVGDDAADGVRVRIAAAVAAPDEELFLLVLGRCIGLGDVERD